MPLQHRSGVRAEGGMKVRKLPGTRLPYAKGLPHESLPLSPYQWVLHCPQDALPAKPFRDVKRRLEAALGQPMETVFQSVEERPIACASIAQVHKATLIGGEVVVIKLQHAEVELRLLQDLRNLETIGEPYTPRRPYPSSPSRPSLKPVHLYHESVN